MKHTDIIIDSDAHFEIDPITRGISNLSPNKMTIIQYDHNSERFTFSMPRFVEGHDMSMSDKVEIHYINIDAGTKEQVCGVFESTDMEVNEEENKLSFSWLISKNATKYVGILSFVVRFSCFDSGDKLAYVWNTGVYSGIAVSKGMYNGEAIVEEYTDVLRQWEEKIKDSVKPYIVTLDYDFETLEVTDSLKHEGIAIGSSDIIDAYNSGKTVILVANGSEIGQLTYVGEYYVRFLLVDTYNHLEFMVIDTSCTITRLINENAENKVNDPESVSEDDYWSVEKYPSMNIMRNYVEGKTGDIETALDNIIAIQNSLMGVSE